MCLLIRTISNICPNFRTIFPLQGVKVDIMLTLKITEDLLQQLKVTRDNPTKNRNHFKKRFINLLMTNLRLQQPYCQPRRKQARDNQTKNRNHFKNKIIKQLITSLLLLLQPYCQLRQTIEILKALLKANYCIGSTWRSEKFYESNLICNNFGF